MRVGLAVTPHNPHDARSDSDVFRDCLKLADLAEPLGFDSVWSVEHHFTNFIMMPDVVQFLSYMAGRTTKIKLGTQVIVLPWHDPIRVAEQIALLDILSGGRTIIGFGRGASTVEYDGLRIPMDDSRDRLVEAAEIVMAALSNETIKYDGRIFQIPELSIRPQPTSFPMTQFYGAATSGRSAEALAKLGLGVMTAFPLFGWEALAQDLANYRDLLSKSGHPPVPPITQVAVYVAETEEQAVREAREYMGVYREAVDAHYGFSDGHLSSVRGYEHYSALAAKDGAGDNTLQVVESFMKVSIVGTPEQCVEQVREVHAHLGFDHLICLFSYGGMSYDKSEQNVRLFAERVLPALQQG
jgi:alkanesulfonate monooxygenase SsuD/methylene tetrahydromethanopterin reductase-like flavin-dependent oxidoreductase (luciferase family)